MDRLWIDDITVLFRNLDKFWPNKKSTRNAQINSLCRYIVYISITFSLYYKNPLFLLIGFTSMIIITKVYPKEVSSKEWKNYNKQFDFKTCDTNENSLPFDNKQCKNPNIDVNNRNCNVISNDPLNHKKLEKTFYKVPEYDTTKFQNFMFNDMSKKTNDYYKGYGGYGN